MSGGQVVAMGQAKAERPRLMEQLDSHAEVLIRKLPLDAIEPDPEQPRIYFDPTELQELADSLKEVGLLQHPAVYPVATDGVRPTRFRLLFGERRWRAARLAGWTEIACQVVPSVQDEDLIARLKRLDQQGQENSARAALTAVEEARGLKQKLDLLRKLDVEAPKTDLVEKLAAERGMSAAAVFRLLDLLDAPESLRTAILERRIVSRELAFLLAGHWTALLREHSSGSTSRRELQFREVVSAWARAQGRELSAETYSAYAVAHFLEPKMVKATIRAAEKIAGEAEEEFAKVVQRAVREAWTVKDARRHLSGARGARKSDAERPRLFEQTTAKGRARLLVHLDLMDDPEAATADARAELAALLRGLLGRLEGGQASV